MLRQPSLIANRIHPQIRHVVFVCWGGGGGGGGREAEREIILCISWEVLSLLIVILDHYHWLFTECICKAVTIIRLPEPTGNRMHRSAKHLNSEQGWG